MKGKFTLFLFCGTLLAASSLAYCETAKSTEAGKKAQLREYTRDEKIAAIDAELKELYKERDTLKLRANYFNREAERLLFLDFLAYRNYIQLAQRDFQRLVEVEQQIATLEAEKKKLQ